jgi:hypothetical protein
MRDLAVLVLHLLATIARLAGPGGARAVVAESVLVKQQLLILNRSRRRSPKLRPADRVVVGLCAVLSQPRAVERRTPRFVARVTSPVRRTRCRSRWSYRCCGRVVGGIIGRFLMPSTPRRRWGASAGVTRTRAGNCRIFVQIARRAAISDGSIAVMAEPLDMSLPVSRSTCACLSVPVLWEWIRNRRARCVLAGANRVSRMSRAVDWTRSRRSRGYRDPM